MVISLVCSADDVVSIMGHKKNKVNGRSIYVYSSIDVNGKVHDSVDVPLLTKNHSYRLLYQFNDALRNAGVKEHCRITANLDNIFNTINY